MHVRWVTCGPPLHASPSDLGVGRIKPLGGGGGGRPDRSVVPGSAAPGGDTRRGRNVIPARRRAREEAASTYRRSNPRTLMAETSPSASEGTPDNPEP